MVAQGVALTVFLVAFVLIAAGAALGANMLLILLGLVVLAVSCAIFMKAKSSGESAG